MQEAATLDLSPLIRIKRNVINRLRTPIRPEILRAAVQRVTQGGTDLMFVHSSLSSCGYFTAGPEDVLEALRDVTATLALPTHSYCYPATIGMCGATFDPALTPSQNGLLTDIFRCGPNARRSLHATHSVAATGSFAIELTSNHHLTQTPCGSGTPYERLVMKRASVLMFGVTFQCYTLFHTAEDAAGSEFAYENGTIDQLEVVDEFGNRHTCRSRRQSRAPRRFEQAGYLLERAKLVRRVQLGRNALLFVPDCSLVHDYLVDRIKKTPDFLHLSCLRDLA
jgi:aminoglycoside 3-N-acetyltransferase